jgi:uncharacterized protein (TIGR04255 family)
MDTTHFQLDRAPIIEAVLDIDCDLPPTLDWNDLKITAREAFREGYPKARQQFVQNHVVTAGEQGAPVFEFNEGLGALQFLTEDEKQLVQFRANGFSFNRLAPYTTLDDYLGEIQSAWEKFRELAGPVMVRKIGLRMINRILLPMEGGHFKISDYLITAPCLPDTGMKLGIVGFLDQQVVADEETGNLVNIVKTSQLPEDDKLPVILDIDAYCLCQMPPPEWSELRPRIESLRNLKNRIFQHTVTAQCLNLFSHSD